MKRSHFRPLGDHHTMAACCPSTSAKNPHQWPELPEPGPYYQLGPDTFRVEMTMHSDNRARLVERLRLLGDKLPKDSVVLLQGGVSEERHATDHELLFRQVGVSDCVGVRDGMV